MAIRTIPAWPSRQQEQPVFDENMANLMVELPLAFGEANEAFAALDMMAVGGGFSLAFTFSTTITDSDPGPGFVRLSSLTQNASTVIRVDLSSAGVDVTPVLDMMDDSTSLIKGQIRLVKRNDPTKWMMFNLMAVAVVAGYRNLTVALVDSSASSPFVNGESVALQFTRTGDKGDVGSVSNPRMKVSDRKASGTTGGASTNAGTAIRTLNTTETNTIAGASLVANQVTLPAGTYLYSGRAPAGQTNGHKAFLYNVTDATVTGIGSSAFSITTGNNNSDSVFSGEFTIVAAKVFEVRHYTTTSGANGLGFASSSGQVEVYTELQLEKVG